MTRNKTMKSVMAAAVVGVMTAAYAAPSLAFDTSGSIDTVTVKIDSRALDSTWGVEQTYAKLSRKADSACTDNGMRGAEARRFADVCSSRLMDDFVESLDNPALTDYHARIGG